MITMGCLIVSRVEGDESLRAQSGKGESFVRRGYLRSRKTDHRYLQIIQRTLLKRPNQINFFENMKAFY